MARSPAFGGRVETFDANAALAIPGVKAVLSVPSGIAVLGTDTWIAQQGRDAVAATIRWQMAEGAQIDTRAQAARFADLARQPGIVAEETGDLAVALKNAAKVVEGDYALPYLAHTTMETLNATIELGTDRAEVWTGTQFQTIDRTKVADVLGLKPEQVLLHTTYLGGGFGRRATPPSLTGFRGWRRIQDSGVES